MNTIGHVRFNIDMRMYILKKKKTKTTEHQMRTVQLPLRYDFDLSSDVMIHCLRFLLINTRNYENKKQIEIDFISIWFLQFV